ncbi:NADPH:quinone reductase [Nitrosomonas sp. PY1]|uniref:zinc-dependent alcohol dehydrogenase family protein n=1 Tax=Nitrosomonas sp. PY1 TaxID=1803906 RepID=UPI001FC8DDEC|nr:zinc-dependent alcohol dehydrogenase family protein [Nitrosomonas sp. PY1]GKS70133.1 NADPH:quinone reductase [Nitrosomonas sp. PY1]
MHAIFFHSGGHSDVLQYGNTLSPQHCNDHQVLVRIKAVGINPIDIKIRTAPDRFPVTFPVIPGCDGAGIVESVGTQVQHFKPGDEVYFSQPGFNGRQGSYAEYVLVDDDLLALKPRSLSFEQAAAAPLVLITAWEALHDRANLHSEQTVLIHAGAGGVGHVAIQLAKLAGAHVITTVSNDQKANYAKRLGADHVINYCNQDVIATVLDRTNGKGVDIAFDTVGSNVLQSCFSCIRPYGDIVTILQPTSDINWSDARLRNARFSMEMMLSPVLLELSEGKSHQAEILRQCAQLFDANQLTIEVASVFNLSEAADAQQYLEQNHPIGKIVLTIPS